jgi:putative FmdB family regulatory protein
MPNYSFKCDGCDHKFEIFLKMSESDKPLKEKCPNCKKKKIKKNWAEQNNIIGFDTTLTPSKVTGSAWKEVVDKIKNSGQVPKRYHERLDNAGRHAGRFY